MEVKTRKDCMVFCGVIYTACFYTLCIDVDGYFLLIGAYDKRLSILKEVYCPEE